MIGEMTRYSKSPDKLNRKNTLVTIQDGDVIFFGIARCNRKAGDRFLKRQGQTIAKARAIRAKIERNITMADHPSETLVLHESNLRGSCAKNSVAELLKYFRTIDDVLKACR